MDKSGYDFQIHRAESDKKDIKYFKQWNHCRPVKSTLHSAHRRKEKLHTFSTWTLNGGSLHASATLSPGKEPPQYPLDMKSNWWTTAARVVEFVWYHVTIAYSNINACEGWSSWTTKSTPVRTATIGCMSAGNVGGHPAHNRHLPTAALARWHYGCDQSVHTPAVTCKNGRTT
jgi:hypothetical protein